MIYAQAARPFRARLEGAATGLTGTIGVLVRDDSSVVSTRTTAGIIETDPGVYRFLGTAPEEPGDYELRWDDGVSPLTPNDVWIEELHVTFGPPSAEPADSQHPAYTPSLTEVAQLILSRTRDDDGNLVGTFNSNTEPTDEEVVPLITGAADEIASSIGSDIPDGPADDPEALRRQARRATALLAAMSVELTFFSEQVNTNRSAYDRLERRLTAQLKQLQVAVTEAGGGQDSGASAEAALPSYDFGPVLGGWDTRRF